MSYNRKSSAVWEFFVKDELGRPFVTCLLCKKEYCSSGNTSNLRDHLKRFHKSEWLKQSEPEATETDSQSRPKPVKQLKLSFVRTPVSEKYNNTNAKKIQLDRILGLMVATDCQPYSVVSDTGFLNFVFALDPKYEVPSRNTLSTKIIPGIFHEVTAKLHKILEVVNNVALTTDTWTSVSSEGYITVTAHFIFENALKSAVLETVQLEGRHTSEAIKNHLQNLVNNKWNLNNKICCLVSDNASTMLKAAELWRVTHLSCFAHTLNLTVMDGLEGNCKTNPNEANTSNDVTDEENLSKLLQKCRNIVKFFKNSTLSMDRLMNEQVKKGKKTPLKPIQDVSTRWNSTLYMLERILVLHADDCLTIALGNSPNAPNILQLDDISAIKEIVCVLKPFEEATIQISGDSYVTISLIIPLVMGIHTSLLSLGTTIKCGIAKNLHSKLLQSSVKRLFPYESRKIPRVATLLDPRFKKLAFRNPENANQAQLFLQQQLAHAVDLQNQKQVESEASHDPADAPMPSTPSKVTPSLFGFLTQRISTTTQVTTSTTESIISVRQYLESKVMPIDTDPLEFWNTQSQSNPVLVDLAKKFLCVPATSVPSERIFSKAGQIISDRRSNLKSKHANQLIFLSQNKWLA